jgi:predicted AAA+ superfamily ATPase
MIERTLEKPLKRLATQYPVVTLTGPRQSGKTTLCKKAFPDKTYLSLEDPDVRQLALSDPRAFLARVKNGVILDEIQKAPELVSYIQSMVDI